MRYAYGVTTALLLGGAAASLVTGLPAGAQVAQNDAQQMQNVVPRFVSNPGAVRSTAGTLGEHNQDFYTRQMGLSEAQLQDLREKSVV